MESPQYMKIAQRIEERRSALVEPLKLPSEQKLAREYGAARDTLRRALSVLEGRGGVTRAPGRGRGTYLMPRRSHPASAKGSSIGIVRPWWAKLSHEWYLSVLIDGVSRWGDEHDCRLSVLDVGRFEDNEHELLEKISARELAGLIWIHPVPEQQKLLSTVSRHMPCVVIGREYENMGLHAVLPDYSQAAALIDTHLVERGHQLYSVLGRSPVDPFGACWLAGFRDAHARRGAFFHDASYYVNVTTFARHLLPELILDFHLASENASSAMVLTCSSYLVALLASKRFRDAIPEEISLVAFDYGVHPTSMYWPGRRITHVTCDWSEIGRKAIEVLFSLVERKTAPKIIHEAVALVDGETVDTRSV